MPGQEQLLLDFAGFYRANLSVVLSFCVGRTRDPELAADLAAEVFAAALLGRENYRPGQGTPRQWLLGIAAHKTADAQRRGHVERTAQHRLGMEAISWTDEDLDHIINAGAAASLLDDLPIEQREAIRARVIDERDYREIAREAGVSQQVVRKRVSRGLATMRRRLKGERHDQRV